MLQASQETTEPGRQLNAHTAGGHGRGQTSQTQVTNSNQLPTHVLTVPQQPRPASGNTRNAHVSNVRGADCDQVFNIKPNAGTFSVIPDYRPGHHSSMPDHMHQGHSGLSHGSHVGHHVDSRMDSHPGTFRVQETNCSNRHNGYRGKHHPSPANMTHFGHGMTNGTGQSGASSSGESSGGVSRRASAFQVHVLHGDQEMKVCHAEHAFAKSDASLHSFGRPSMTAISVFRICFPFQCRHWMQQGTVIDPILQQLLKSNLLGCFAALAKGKSHGTSNLAR